MTPEAPRFAMVAGEASGDVLAGLLLDGLRARWPALVAEGIGGPRMAEQRLRGLVAARQARGARLRRGARPLPRDRRHPQPADRAADEGQARRLHRRRRARLQPRPRGQAARRRREDGALRQPLDLGLARQAGREDQEGRRPGALHLPVRARDLRQARGRRGLRRPPDRQRDPDGAAAGRGAGRARGRRRRDPDRACCPGSRRSEIQYIAPRLFGAAREIAKARPGIRFVVPVVTGTAPRDRAVAPPVRAGRGDRAARRPRPRGARRLRRGARRQRHRDARGGALQAADGRRLRMHAISWQMGKRMHYQPWISLPNILLRDFAVPELLQRDASPEKIAAAAFKWLDDPAACEALRVALRGGAPRAASRHRPARHRCDRGRPERHDRACTPRPSFAPRSCA